LYNSGALIQTAWLYCPTMPVIIALLRGVNLTSYNRMKMEDLRIVCKSLKFRDVQTYIQSGNVVFRTDENDPVKLAQRLEDAISKKFGFRPAVVVRTTNELRKVVAKNPFAKRDGINPSNLAVFFHADDPGKDARAQALALKAACPEELYFNGRELYIYFPEGQGRTKLPLAKIARIVKTPATARNWNSVTKLLEMAEQLEKNG
jgi:uncharacterized protein (DUF1697 family)